MLINSNVEVMYTKQQIADKVTKLAKQISVDYKGVDSITLIAVLRGSAIFLADLIREIELENIGMDFLTVSSYGNATTSSGEIKIIKDLDEDITNKHVLIIEDIIDTGYTLQKVINLLKLRNPLSVKTCCLLNKPSRRKVDIAVDYIGFNIEDFFVVGYGIDYAQKYRNLAYLGKVLNTN